MIFKKSYKLCGYDVVITVSVLCEDSFTKTTTGESLILMWLLRLSSHVKVALIEVFSFYTEFTLTRFFVL